MDLLLNLFVKAEIYIVFLIALNSLMLGKLNLWAIGNIVYFSFGAFITGFFANVLNISGYWSYSLFIIVPLVSVLISLIFFSISRLLKDDFFLFFSLFFIELNLVFNTQIAGPSGYSHIIRPPGLSSDFSLCIILSVVLSLLIIWMKLFNQSRVNYLHSLIRNNETLAESFGVNISGILKPVFVSSAVISGISGVFFAFYSFGADPVIFTTNEVIILFILLLLGGIDSIKGAVIAGLVFVFLTYFLDSALSGSLKILAPKISHIIFGLFLIIIPFVFPKGLFGKRSI
jgi:branched-chain amino acid transport system permease protein